jgi:hypothetical protein
MNVDIDRGLLRDRVYRHQTTERQRQMKIPAEIFHETHLSLSGESKIRQQRVTSDQALKTFF